MKNETQWTATRLDRKYLPNQLTGDRESVTLQLENLLVERHLLGSVEAMTDQLDVYIKGARLLFTCPSTNRSTSGG